MGSNVIVWSRSISGYYDNKESLLSVFQTKNSKGVKEKITHSNNEAPNNETPCEKLAKAKGVVVVVCPSGTASALISQRLGKQGRGGGRSRKLTGH